jgi:predicted kinase
MKNLVMLIGLPRSGKSTLKSLIKIQHKTYISVSADDLRYLIYGQRYFQNGEPLVWAVRGYMLNLLMQNDHDLIIDECNTTEMRRYQILHEAKKYNYNVIGIHIDTDYITCIGRGDKDIINVIERMNEKFEIPTMKEGYDTLIACRDNEYFLALEEINKY